jgi:RNA polymerase sigma-70 factor, ECF subfamily
MTRSRLELAAANASSVGTTVTLDGEAAWSGEAEPSVSVSVSVASDDELMRMARSGTRRAFDELIRRHQGRVIRIALRHTGGLAIAQEVAQETFVDLFRALPNYRPRGQFSAFLFRILINRCRMEFRRRRVREAGSVLTLTPERSSDVTSLDIILARERDRRLNLEIQRLSKPLRDVIALWGEGLADKEIAEILGKPMGTVRRRRFEAVEKLRQRLEDK